MLDIFMSRARFHQMIWTAPRAVVLARLGLGEAGFLRLCQESRIPAPPGQAWVKPATTNQHYRIRLPKRELGENPFVFVSGDFTRQEQGAHLAEMLSEPLDDLEDMTARFRKRLAKINEHDDPFRLHASIADLVRPVPSAANNEAAVDARRMEQRRLTLLNEIFLYAEALGGHCRFGGPAGHRHAIRIGHVNVAFTLDTFARDDRLRLDIVSRNPLPDIRRSWEDTGLVTLENIVPELMVGIGLVAEAICRNERNSWKSETVILAGDRSPLAPAMHG